MKPVRQIPRSKSNMQFEIMGKSSPQTSTLETENDRKAIDWRAQRYATCSASLCSTQARGFTPLH
jgi:hypothetical protein